MNVDVILVLVASASVPVYAAGMARSWRQWRRWHDDRARREFVTTLLWMIVALSAFATVVSARMLGLGVYDPVRIGALGGLFGALFCTGIVLLVEWHDR